MDFSSLGKWIFLSGLFLAEIGFLIWLAGRLGLPVGRLPGDVRIERDGFSFLFPHRHRDRRQCFAHPYSERSIAPVEKINGLRRCFKTSREPRCERCGVRCKARRGGISTERYGDEE